MTLNLTLLTQDTIYQSADYRLSDPNTGALYEAPSTKRVSVQYVEWSGFVTYTGVGKVHGKSTSEIIEGWLDGRGDLSFPEFCELLRYSASNWLRSISYPGGHSFIVIGFVSMKATAAIVSNIHRWHGAPLPKGTTEFVTTIVVYDGKPQLLVTGVSGAVPREQRHLIRRAAAEHQGDPARVRRTLERANRTGAMKYARLISQDCIVYSIDRYGRSFEETFGASQTRASMISHGTSLNKVLEPFLDQQFGKGNYTVAGTTGAKSESAQAPTSVCEPVIANGSGEYQLLALALPDGQRATPRGIDAGGIAYGEGTPQQGGPSYPCIWPTRQDVVFLKHGGGYGGAVVDANDNGTFVGRTELPDRSTRACSWSVAEGLELRVWDSPGLYSGAAAVNGAGHAVGYTNIGGESGQSHHRPTSWPSDGAPIILEDLGGGWGEAIDINEHGDIAVRVHSGDTSAWVWNGDRVERVANPEGVRHFYPHEITGDGSLLGLAIEENQSRYGVIRRPNGTWDRLFPVQQNREFQASYGEAIVGGRESIDNYLLPWVKRMNGLLQPLPFLRFHNHQIGRIELLPV